MLVKREETALVVPFERDDDEEKPKPTHGVLLVNTKMILNFSELADLRLKYSLLLGTGEMGKYRAMPKWKGQLEDVLAFEDELYLKYGYYERQSGRLTRCFVRPKGE